MEFVMSKKLETKEKLERALAKFNELQGAAYIIERKNGYEKLGFIHTESEIQALKDALELLED
jgi:hypothetical protein